MIRALLSAEILKFTKQSKTYYALGAIFLIEVLILMTAYYQGSTILDLLLDSLKQSFYFEGSLLNGNLIMYIVLNALWFNVPLIIMIIAAGIITDEYKDGTVQAVMLQAVNKSSFMFAKYIMVILFTLFVIVFMVLTAFLMAYAIFGTGDLVVYLDTLNFFESGEAFRRICWAFASGSVTMIFYSIVSATLAILIKEATKTWIAAALFLVVCNLLLKIDLGTSVMNSFFFPKLVDTWQQLFYYEINWQQIIINNVVLLIYSGILTAIGISTFHKKEIK